MYPDSRQTIHMGLNFVFSPLPAIDKHKHLAFQQALMERGIDFSSTLHREQEVVVIREQPVRLETRVLAQSHAPLGQLTILAPQPGGSLELFTAEAEAIVGAFECTWQHDRRQVVKSDATFRDLYETSATHAFQELWEQRLGQSPNTLAVLGRRVLGGGLRFVMPPQAGDPEPVQVDVRIESFLQDAKKIYVETQFTWPAPAPPGAPLDPASRLRQIDTYIEGEITAFLVGGSQ